MKEDTFSNRKEPPQTPAGNAAAQGDAHDGTAQGNAHDGTAHSDLHNGTLHGDTAQDAPHPGSGKTMQGDATHQQRQSCIPDAPYVTPAAHHPASCTGMSEAERDGRRVTLISLWLNFLLGFGKTGIGYFANSSALFADGLNSLSDLSTDIAALFGIRMANKPEDDNHLYGHHKFASLVSLFISCMVLIVCIGLIGSSAWALWHTEPVILSWLPFCVAAISMVSKELMHRRTRSVATRTGSRILAANALNQRTDAFSSGLVLVALLAVGIGGQRLAFVDKAMGIVMGVWFGIAVIKMLRESLDDLLDAAPEKAMLDDIREHILPVQGAVGYHKFRSRRVGDRFEVDMHLQVEPDLTVEQGHDIASAVRDDILRQHPEVINVLIHVEPAAGRHLHTKGLSSS